MDEENEFDGRWRSDINLSSPQLSIIKSPCYFIDKYFTSTTR